MSDESGRHEPDGPSDPSADGSRFDRSHWTSLVVPDDIRSLEGDIRAYHREQRAARRRSVLGRACRRGRVGLAFPVAMGILLVAAIYSAVVMMTTAPRPGSDDNAPLATPSASAGRVGGLLPDLSVRSAGGADEPLRSLRPAAIVLVPASCACQEALTSVVAAGNRAGVRTYAVGTALPPAIDGGPATTARLAEPLGHLLSTYSVGTQPVTLLVRSDGVVRKLYARSPEAPSLRTELASLR